MAAMESKNIERQDFVPGQTNTSASSSPSSSQNPTPAGTPTQEHPLSSTMPSYSPSNTSSTTPLPPQPQSPDESLRGRPRYKRRQPSRRYFTPPSRIPSPVRPDMMLEVETMPQDPDIFADAETDYFSSTDRADGPRAYRRHFFDALPSVDSSIAMNERQVGSMSVSIDGRLAER